MKQDCIKAETEGKGFYKSQPEATHKQAEKYARNNYNSGLLQDCFVAGYNMAKWDAIAEQLKNAK